MVEQANLEVLHSGNHSVDFQDYNVRIDPYNLFLHTMKSPVTKKKYSKRLEMFFNFIKIRGENMKEQCLTFVNSDSFIGEKTRMIESLTFLIACTI